MTAIAFAPDTPRTKAGTPLVKLALSRAKKSGAFDEIFKATGYRVAIGLRPNGSQTGSWTFTRKRGGSRHEITLDPNAHKGISTTPPRHTADEWTLSCFAAILRHEAHHALYTDRDLFKLNRECGAHGIPFVSVNIGEDIRIDKLAVDKHGLYNWWKWYDAKSKPETAEPLAWLVWAKIYESSAPTLVKWTGVGHAHRIRLGKPDTLGMRPVMAVLAEFYADFQKAKDTMAVVTLMRDLFLTFPAAQKDVTKIGGLPSGGVGHGYGGTEESDTLIHKDTPVTMGEVSGDPAKHKDSPMVDVARFSTHAGMSDEDFVKATGRDLRGFVRDAQRVAERLARMMGRENGVPDRASTSGRRVHVGNAMAGRAEAFRVAGELRGTAPRVVALFDQSGSMNGDFATHGAAFLAAMLTLSQQGIIDGRIILTGGGKHAIVPPTFPVGRVMRFRCNEGCETVKDTLDAQKRLVQSADVVLVYTDGQLTDGVVDAGKWRSHGVDLIGCAVTTGLGGYDGEYKRAAMTKHFHRALLAESGEELATKIAQYIATRS